MCYIISSKTNTNQATTFAISNTKLYVPVVTLSTQDKEDLLQRFKSRFKHTVTWNKYQSKHQHKHKTSIIDSSFEVVNSLDAHVKVMQQIIALKI